MLLKPYFIQFFKEFTPFNYFILCFLPFFHLTRIYLPRVFVLSWHAFSYSLCSVGMLSPIHFSNFQEDHHCLYLNNDSHSGTFKSRLRGEWVRSSPGTQGE